MEDKITYFAETDARNRRVRFGIKAKDRTRHIYVIGKTGMGKSTMLENMAIQDIQTGEGMALIDPHGGTARKLLEYVPAHRVKDVVFFNPADLDNPISFNVLEDVEPDKRHFVAAGLMNTFKKIWQDAWSARMEYILGNTLLALLEYPGATLLSVNKMLTDKGYRQAVVDNVKDPSVRSFWVDEFAKYTDKFAAEATPAIQNKIGQFTSNPLIRNLIGQPKSSFDFRQMMDEKKIIIVNLAKGELGPDNMRLIGGMIVTKIYLAAMSRANVSAARLKDLPPFYFYVDEFQNFANESFAEILSEARKYKLALTVANQYIEQMTEEVRAAVVGNVGTMVVFRIGSTDADILEKEYAPEFTPEDMVNLGFAQIYLKLMIDGVTSRPFSATTLPPIPLGAVNNKDDVIEWSRKQFSKPRDMVEKAINDWYNELAVKSAGQPSAKKDGGYSAGGDFRKKPLPPATPQDNRSNIGRSGPARDSAPRASQNPIRPFVDRRSVATPTRFTPPTPVTPMPPIEPEEGEKEEFVPLNKIADSLKDKKVIASDVESSKTERGNPVSSPSVIPASVSANEREAPPDQSSRAGVQAPSSSVITKKLEIQNSRPQSNHPHITPSPVIASKVESPKSQRSNPDPASSVVSSQVLVSDSRPHANPPHTFSSSEPKPNYGGKKATPQNMSDLKSLLQSVMKKNNTTSTTQNVTSTTLVSNSTPVSSQPVHQVSKAVSVDKTLEQARVVAQETESMMKAEEKPPISGKPVDTKYWGGEDQKIEGIFLNGKPYREVKAEYGHLLNPEHDVEESKKPNEIPKDVLQKMLKVEEK